MGSALTSWESRVRALLGNPTPQQLSPQDAQDHVRAAVRTFSSDRPRVTYVDYNGDGATFSLTIPVSWVPGFSNLMAIEYPQGERDPVMLDLKEAAVYPSDSAPAFIRLAQTTPETGKVLRAFFTLPWPIPDATSSTDKIADVDFEAVCHLGAAYAARSLAGRASGARSPVIPAASQAGWEQERQRWSDEAGTHMQIYQDHVGGGSAGPADGVTDWDVQSAYPYQGGAFLTRNSRR
jgi:hypothetical protein